MKAQNNSGRLDPLNDPIQFGAHVGAKIPRLILINPGWYFWSIENGTLVKSFDKELLQQLFRKTTQINIPSASGKVIVADYFNIHGNGLTDVKLRPASDSGTILTSGEVVTKCVLDLSHAYYCASDSTKPNYAPVQNHVIDLYFGGSKANVTEDAAIRFFSNPANFANSEQS